ncbi:MAG: alpha/beta hydrolase [Anaerolineae bacterium]
MIQRQMSRRSFFRWSALTTTVFLAACRNAGRSTPAASVAARPTDTPTNVPEPTETPADVRLPTTTPTNVPVPTATPTNMPMPTATTVSEVPRQATEREVIYLWEEGNVPTTTVYTEDPNSQYFDPPDFRPNMVYYPARPGVPVKGAVLICAGGAFAFRGNEREGTPVAQALNDLGYQSFVVNYRLRPFAMQEGALDLARAVRYVRAHAGDYGIADQGISVIGFSAGGILCGELLLNFDGSVNGTAIDPDYVPDELDRVSADASAVGMIYSFYGRLSVASTDVDKFKSSDLPPAFFVYGTRDPFVGEFEKCIKALRQAGVPVEDHVLQDWPHGFGAGDGQWIQDFDRWVTDVYENS